MATAVQERTYHDGSPSSWDEAATSTELTAEAAALTHRSPPSRVGRYTIEAELGRGSCVVYRAADPVLGRKVALKVVDQTLPMREEERRLMEQRFLHEARLAACLAHPNIVVVHDVGWDAEASTPFIALEYLEGRTLAEVLASGPVGWSEALRLVSTLAGALHHAHGHGIVHRDIKPANIMILPSGDPKIMDFGIADLSAVEPTAEGECWGTPQYMSPEQACGRSMDGRTDLFSLGSVLYLLLTGQRPFEGEGAPQIVASVVCHEPLPPSYLRPALPRDLDVVITRALAKDPEQRYPDGHAFAEDLQDVLHSRPLRERAGLKAPAVIEPTLGRPPLGHAAPALLGTRPQERRLSPRPGPLLTAGAALAIGLALLGFRYTTVAAKTPARPGAPVAAVALAPPVASAPAPSVLRPTAGHSSSQPAVAAPALTRRPVPMASVPKPTTTPEPLAVPVAPTVPQARLAVSVQHGLKQGRLRLWIDERLVLETLLVGTETRRLLLFKKRKGSLAEVFDVAPGERLVRVEVEEDGRRRSADLSGDFEGRKTRLLEVKLGGRVGLKWKS